MSELIKNIIVFLSSHPVLLIIFGGFCLNFKECNWNALSIFQDTEIEVHNYGNISSYFLRKRFQFARQQSMGRFLDRFNILVGGVDNSVLDSFRIKKEEFE